jgi:hypothetical protein
MRPRGLATVVFGSALLGAVAVLLVAWSAGWLHGERRTVVLQEAVPVVQVSAPRVRPLLGRAFDPAGIYAGRSAGVVTIFSAARPLRRARDSSSRPTASSSPTRT